MAERRILLIGKTGDGKSSTGNTILRKKVFLSKASAKSVTSKTVAKRGVVNGRKMTVIDMPGFFDTDRDEMEIRSEIIKGLIECSPRVHAIGIVIKVGRYTSHEAEVMQKLLDIVSEDALKHAVILFTFGEQLEGQTIKEFVKASSKLQELVDKCGGRYHVIDNKYWNKNESGDKSNRVQVKNLLDTIDKMVKENGCFTNELLQSVDKQVKKEVKINQENLSPEEKQEKAKEIVHDKFWEKVVGTATGVLIGALLGVGVALVSVAVFAAGAAGKGAAAAAAVKGGAAAAVKGGAAAAVKGGAAAAVKVGAAAVVETAVTGGAAAETGAVVGAAGTGTTIAAVVLGGAAVAGAIGGGITGWEAAEEAESVCDAMKKAAEANYDNAIYTIEKIKELGKVVFDKQNMTKMLKKDS